MKHHGNRSLRSSAELVSTLQRAVRAGRTIPLLVLRLPAFGQLALREGKRAALRVERASSEAFCEAATRVLREGDEVAHDGGNDWFAVAMLAPARDGAWFPVSDARAALERIAAAISLTTGLRMETGWWPVGSDADLCDTSALVERALERGARERERYEFLATVGHELRTPLTSIRGYIETLLDDEIDARTARRFLETARSEALRLGRLVDGIVDFSLLDLSPRPARGGVTEIGDAMVAVAAVLAPLASEAGIRIHIDSVQRQFVRIERDACMHMLVNLVENAIKYGVDGGVVTLHAERQDPFVCITVDDDGPGIASVDRERIFEHRARGSLAERKPGTGIGLSIVRTIVERVAGSVHAEPSALGGARFVVRLPCAEAESVTSSS